MKKVLGLVLAGVLAVTAFSGCKKTAKIVVPEYEDRQEMMLGGWDSPLPTVNDYKMAKDMGLTHMFVDEAFAARGTKAFEDILGYCDEAGIKAIVGMGNGEQVENPKVDTTDYSKFAAVDGINYWDEPWFSTFDKLSNMAEEHVEKYGDKLKYFVNMYPNTATGTFGGKNFQEFIAAFGDTVLGKLTTGQKILSCDQYPLMYDSVKKINYMKSTYLYCIETVANEAKKIGADTHFFLQLTKHYNYRAVNADDLRFQFYTNMAFGVKAFTYFTYRDSFLNDFDKSCVDKNISCKPNEPYFIAQQVNEEIKKFDHVYLNFDWNGTMPIIGTNQDGVANDNFETLTSPLKKVDCLQSVSAEEDALIGQFKDKAGRDGLIVTNFSDPILEIYNTLDLKFANARAVAVYRHGKRKVYQTPKGELKLELDPGEGVFLIPLQ